ncbi:MAG: beta-propeller domain-containing protein [Clostridia bacterium]|nr:beta-propeller domain-containing protein [Clostridia bacterium]
MKNERLLDKMNLLDDKYINEANPENKKKKKKINWLRFGTLAACICLMVTALNLFLFLPFKTTVPDVSQYEDSEYFPIIEKINALSAVKPKYKNNFDKILSSLSAVGGAFDNKVDADMGISGVDKNESVDGVTPPSDSFTDGDVEDSEENGKYEEITDNQVEGVTEGDIIKRSDKYIFYLSPSYGRLKVYSIKKEDSKLVGELYFNDLDLRVNKKTESGDVSNPNMKEETSYGLWSYSSEMYLSTDCKTVTVLGMFNGKTSVICLDVSNVETKITLKNYVLIEGTYKTSRMVDGKLLVITSKYFYKNVDFSKEETFVPSVTYNNGNETALVPMDKIACADKLTENHYTVVSLLDENTLDFKGCASFFSFTNDIYVTNNGIYASNTLNEDIKNFTSSKSKKITEIACISYGDDGFEIKGAIKVDGYIKDRYSFDEYNGILRVVTTTSTFTEKTYSFEGNESFVLTASDGTSASLYCIDLASWKVVASVENFAPKDETVRSVRFDKNYAYVCTAVQLTDPVFFFDLSDINNITYKETGNIEGFSTSLINLGNGFLLGIGRGDTWDTVKVEVYRESENKVVSVCSYEIEHASYSESYKSYYVNRNTGMFGFGYYDYMANGHPIYKNRYVLLQFTNGELIEVVNTTVNSDNRTSMRSVYIDGYLYILGDNDFKVIQI